MSSTDDILSRTWPHSLPWRSRRLHHIGIDETQSFLLPGTDQQGTVYFNAVDVHHVLVETTAAYVILRAEFIVATYSGLCSYHGFYASARSVRGQAVLLGFYLLDGSGLPAALCYLTSPSSKSSSGGKVIFRLIFPCGRTNFRLRVWYPSMEKMTVTLSRLSNFSEYLPFRLLTVPIAVPSNRIVANSIGLPFHP